MFPNEDFNMAHAQLPNRFKRFAVQHPYILTALSMIVGAVASFMAFAP